MKSVLAVLLASTVCGCATNSGVVATGADTYFVSRQGTGFSGMGTLKAEAMGEAGQFCGAKGLVPQVTQESEAKPPFVLGNYPRVEVQFRCITKESRPPLSSFYR